MARCAFVCMEKRIVVDIVVGTHSTKSRNHTHCRNILANIMFACGRKRRWWHALGQNHFVILCRKRKRFLGVRVRAQCFDLLRSVRPVDKKRHVLFEVSVRECVWLNVSRAYLLSRSNVFALITFL